MSMQRTVCVRYLVAAIIPIFMLLAPAIVATAANKFWKNSVGSGNWSGGNNWSNVSAAGADNGGAPIAGDLVFISPTTDANRTITFDNTSGATFGSLTVNLMPHSGNNTTTLLMSANNLSATSESIGDSGAGSNGIGTFTQSGGINTVGTGNLRLGVNATDQAFYNLSGTGQLFSNGFEYIGVNGTGTFTQSGGTHSISSGKFLDLGLGTAATGTYNLSAGSLTAPDEYVGDQGVGNFNHSGGTNTIANSLTIGFTAGATGTYMLSGTGQLSVAQNLFVGRNTGSTGTFNQTGGTNTIANNLSIGTHVGGSGAYTISAGTLAATNNIIVGDSGTGTLNIDGTGTASTNGLWINSASTLNLNGGTLRFNTIGGTGGLSRLNYTAGNIQLPGDHSYEGGSVFNYFFGSGFFDGEIPSGKGAIIEGDFTLNTRLSGQSSTEFVVNGGSLTSTNLWVGTEAFRTGWLRIVNGGRVTATEDVHLGLAVDGYGSLVTVSGAGSSLTSGGYLAVSGNTASTLNVIDQGLVYVAGSLSTGLGGTINLSGGTLRFFDFNGQGGTLNYTAGTIQLAGNRSIGADKNITDIFGAAPTLTSGKGLTVEGTATLLTTVTLDGGTFSANAVAGGNYLQLYRGTLNLMNQAFTIGSGGPLGSALDVNEDMTVNVTLGITNQGLVTGDGQIGGTFANAATGELRGEPGKSLKLTGAGNTNAGRINLLGGMVEFTQNLTNSPGALISGNGSLRTGAGLVNQGTMNFAGTANIAGDVTNAPSGKIISAGGGATIFYDDVTNNGEIRTSTNGFTVFFGSVSGSGTFTGTGTVNFEGDLSPGSSPAAVNFAGDVVFGPDATLEIEIGGTTAGSQYDQINVASELTLGGTLEISLINGFTPSAGQTFDVLNWGSLAGAFSSVQLPALPGLAWNTSQLTSGMLSVVIPGDFNLDGAVDSADYVVWRKNDGIQTSFNLWRANFGRTAGSGSGQHALSAVPEPANLALLMFAILGLSVTRIKKPRCYRG